MSEIDPEVLCVILAEESDAAGLQTYYRDCVRPILWAPVERWPRCCGAGCEPCNQVLCEVARRVLARIAPPAQ